METFFGFWDFLAMGGHGVFIWPSYLLTLLVLLANGFAARRQRRQALQQIVAQLTKTDSASAIKNNGEST